MIHRISSAEELGLMVKEHGMVLSACECIFSMNMYSLCLLWYMSSSEEKKIIKSVH